MNQRAQDLQLEDRWPNPQSSAGGEPLVRLASVLGTARRRGDRPGKARRFQRPDPRASAQDRHDLHHWQGGIPLHG